MRRLLSRPVPFWKRALDVVGALLTLVLLSPVLLLISLYIKLVSPGPVLFRQKRIGHGGVPFSFLKFRTMRVDSSPVTHQSHLRELIHSDRPMQKLDRVRDSRIIPGGSHPPQGQPRRAAAAAQRAARRDEPGRSRAPACPTRPGSTTAGTRSASTCCRA